MTTSSKPLLREEEMETQESQGLVPLPVSGKLGQTPCRTGSACKPRLGDFPVPGRLFLIRKSDKAANEKG